MKGKHRLFSKIFNLTPCLCTYWVYPFANNEADLSSALSGADIGGHNYANWNQSARKIQLPHDSTHHLIDGGGLVIGVGNVRSTSN